VVWRGSGGSGE
jgi:hypothetical protein